MEPFAVRHADDPRPAALMEADVCVVGAGPAGLTAASVMAAAGLGVALFDDNPRPGGQYFKQTPPGFRAGPGALSPEPERAEALLAVTRDANVRYRPDTTIWARAESDTLAYAGEGGSGRVRARATVIAAGAHDRAVPFPGWTLPGVVTAGGALNLMKGQRLLPGRRVVVVGNGPLLLVTANALLASGAELAAVIEAGRPDRALAASASRLAAAPGLLFKGLGYRRAMRRERVAYSVGQTIVEAIGTGAVRAARIAPITRQGVVDRGRTRLVEADAVVVGFGLSPSVELTRMIGCAHSFDAALGGWIPIRSADLETSESGIFSLGDGAGIGGVEVATAEGRLAGLAIVRRLRGGGKAIDAALGHARARLARLYRFRDGLNRLFRGPASYLELLTPETTVCRCENLTAGRLTEALRACEGDLGQVKYATRLSMGRCQGRNCLRTLSDMADRDASEERAALPGMRAPARPVRLSDLLDEPLGDARPPDMTLP